MCVCAPSSISLFCRSSWRTSQAWQAGQHRQQQNGRGYEAVVTGGNNGKMGKGIHIYGKISTIRMI